MSRPAVRAVERRPHSIGGGTLNRLERDVNKRPPVCREHMICPLPRANEMSAFRAGCRTSISNQGGADGRYGDRRGAAMTYQQVIMRVRAGSLSWLQAADILNIYPRSLRRWRARYEQDPKLPLAPAISASHHTEDDSSAIGVARIARRSLEPR